MRLHLTRTGRALVVPVVALLCILFLLTSPNSVSSPRAGSGNAASSAAPVVLIVSLSRDKFEAAKRHVWQAGFNTRLPPLRSSTASSAAELDGATKGEAGIEPIQWVRGVDGRAQDLGKLVQCGILSPLGYAWASSGTTIVGGTHLTIGALGCYLAHIRTWRKVLELGRPAIVLEDDTQLLPGFKMHLQRAMAELPSDWHLLYLASLVSGTTRRVWMATRPYSAHLYRMHGETWGTYGYVVSPEAARHLLSLAYPIQHQVDSQIIWTARFLRLNVFRCTSNLVATDNAQGRESLTQRYSLKPHDGLPFVFHRIDDAGTITTQVTEPAFLPRQLYRSWLCRRGFVSCSMFEEDGDTSSSQVKAPQFGFITKQTVTHAESSTAGDALAVRMAGTARQYGKHRLAALLTCVQTLREHGGICITSNFTDFGIYHHWASMLWRVDAFIATAQPVTAAGLSSVAPLPLSPDIASASKLDASNYSSVVNVFKGDQMQQLLQQCHGLRHRLMPSVLGARRDARMTQLLLQRIDALFLDSPDAIASQSEDAVMETILQPFRTACPHDKRCRVFAPSVFDPTYAEQASLRELDAGLKYAEVSATLGAQGNTVFVGVSLKDQTAAAAHQQVDALVGVSDKSMTQSPPPIPRILHIVWMACRSENYGVPAAQVRAMQSWVKHHPDWEVKVWTHRDLASATAFSKLAVDVITSTSSTALRNVITGIEVLHKHGGVVVDGMLESLQPVDSVLSHYDCGIGLPAVDEELPSLAAFLACRPGHAGLAQLRRTVVSSISAGMTLTQQYSAMRFALVDVARTLVPSLPNHLFFPLDFAQRRFNRRYKCLQQTCRLFGALTIPLWDPRNAEDILRDDAVQPSCRSGRTFGSVNLRGLVLGPGA